MENSIKHHAHLFFDPENDLISTFKNGSFLTLSPAWSKHLGWTVEEIANLKMEELIHPDDLQKTIREVEITKSSGQSVGFVNRYITKNRDIKWFKWRCFVNPENETEIMSVGVDLTELYQKDHAHRVSQDMAQIGNWTFTKASKEFKWSQQICEIYETAFDTNFPKVMKANFHDEMNWEKMASAFTNCLEKDLSVNEEVELTTPSGKKKWISCWWVPKKIKNEIVGIEGLIQDITVRKERENTIQEADNRYQVVLSGIQAGIWDWNLNERSNLYWSPKLYELFGYDPESTSPSIELSRQLIHPDDLDKVNEGVHNLLEYNVHYLLEFRVKCSDDSYRWIQSSAVVLRDSHGQPTRIIGTVADIHQKKMAEANLEEEQQKTIQASKLATLGEMAAGVAHEVNNPLTIIFGYIRVLEEELSSTELNIEQTKKFLGLIKTAAERAAKIVGSLKEFARDGAQDPFEDYPASEIMNMVMELLRERFKKNDVRLEVELLSDPLVHCRKLEISQVILNLLFNSFDAIQEYNQKWVKIQIKKAEGKINISVTDCGHGLLPEVADKVFTPFFTTKKNGQGTGLGLSISQRIIVNHGGEILYDSSSLNTKFVIKLPLYYELP